MKSTAKSIMLALAVMLFIPGVVMAGQWEGSIQGLTCALHDKVCPTGMEDPIVALEDNFVLVTGGDAWYLLPNLDQGILVRHLNEPVRVIGEKNAKHSAITVKELQAKKDGEWKTVWSLELQEKAENHIRDWGGF